MATKREPTFDEWKELVANVAHARSELIRALMDPRRDIDDECGYPKQISPAMFQEMYDRCSVAARVVEVLPKEAFQTQPIAYEAEDGETATPFELAFDAMCKTLRGQKSWFAGDEGNPFWEYAERFTVQMGIGSYGALLYGIDDGRPLHEPAAGVEEQNSAPVEVEQGAPVVPSYNSGRYTLNAVPQTGRKLMYMRVYSEVAAPIAAYESNASSPRCGRPTMYTLDGVKVHWTRVVHGADNLSSSEWVGDSRLKTVSNNIQNIRKVEGASAEGYWKSCFTGLSLETDPSLGGDVRVDREALKDMVENYQNGLQRALFLMGMSAKTLAPSVVDPTPYIASQIEAICIRLGVPIRVFKGSERGELASGQDDDAWNDRLKQYRNSFITPRVIVPMVDRLILLGVLPAPSMYYVWWPDLTSNSGLQKAQIALTRTQVMTTYIGGNGPSLMAPHDFLTRELEYTDEEAASILENAADEAASDPVGATAADPGLGSGESGSNANSDAP